MKPILQFIAATAALAAAPAFAAPIDSAKIIAALKAGEAQWNADIVARDPVKFASHYDDAATAMNPGEPPTHGRAAIEASARQAFADPNFTQTYVVDDAGVSADGTMGWTQGHCTETDTNPTTHARGVHACASLTLFKLEADGSWKAIEDIDTPIPPAH
jgi:uncharacterized protein (TIGR02246 family)